MIENSQDIIDITLENKEKYRLNKALYEAVSCNNYDETKHLIEKGANIHLKNQKKSKIFSEDAYLRTVLT